MITRSSTGPCLSARAKVVAEKPWTGNGSRKRLPSWKRETGTVGMVVGVRLKGWMFLC